MLVVFLCCHCCYYEILRKKERLDNKHYYSRVYSNYLLFQSHITDQLEWLTDWLDNLEHLPNPCNQNAVSMLAHIFFPVLADSNSSKGAYSTENSSFTLLSIMISMFLMHTSTLSKAFSVGFKCFYNPLRYRNDSYSALAWSSSLSLASIFPSSSSSFSPLSCYFKRFLLMFMGPLSIPFSSVTCS